MESHRLHVHSEIPNFLSLQRTPQDPILPKIHSSENGIPDPDSQVTCFLPHEGTEGVLRLLCSFLDYPDAFFSLFSFFQEPTGQRSFLVHNNTYDPDPTLAYFSSKGHQL